MRFAKKGEEEDGRRAAVVGIRCDSFPLALPAPRARAASAYYFAR